MPEPPGHPRFEPCYEASFDEDVRNLGFTGRNFMYEFRRAEIAIGNYPWNYAEEVPDSGGIWMRPTARILPDLPPMYVYYRIEQNPNKIIYLGLSSAWSTEDLPPLGP